MHQVQRKKEISVPTFLQPINWYNLTNLTYLDTFGHMVYCNMLCLYIIYIYIYIILSMYIIYNMHIHAYICKYMCIHYYNLLYAICYTYAIYIQVI